MEGRIFIDTNLLIYYVSDDLQKKEIVRDLLLSAKSISVSSQVITEFVAVSLKKKINPPEETISFAREFMELFEVSAVDAAVILRSFEIMQTHKFSSWDSLIIAAALQSKASVLYTEDLQHGQKIEKMKIVNPFQQKD
jgi:predicted nucleic acid-binding protein